MTERTKKRSFAIIAGGTGGHVYPAISLAEQLVRYKYSIVILTDKRGKKFIKPSNNIKVLILSSPKRTEGWLASAEKLYFLIKNFFDSMKKLQSLKPSSVVGFGGYYSISPIIASYALKIPIIIHEQNAVAGRANRFLFPVANKIAISFKRIDGLKSNNKKITRTGTPIRSEFFKLTKALRPRYGKKIDLKVLIIGGSQGAQSFSKIIPQAVALMNARERKRISINQQCNRGNIYQLKKTYDNLGVRADLKIFFDNMPKALTSCHFAIARAGASTIAELEATNTPSILIPYPYAKDDHQSQNAWMMKEAGLSWVLEEEKGTSALLSKLIQKFIKDPRILLNKRENRRTRVSKNGGNNLAKHCINILNEKI